MHRIHRTIAVSLVALGVWGGAALAQEQAAPTTSGPRFAIAQQLPAIHALEASDDSRRDLEHLRAGMADAGPGTVTVDDLTAEGGVVAETTTNRMSVFANAEGGVCYLATRLAFDTPAEGAPFAGGCFEQLTDAGIQYAVAIEAGGVRIFGVAGEGVERVGVTTRSGSQTSVTVERNAFVWANEDPADVPTSITSFGTRGELAEPIVLDELSD